MRRASLLLALLLSAPTAIRGQSAACATPRKAASPARVPFELINNHVYVRVCVVGQEKTFILDTGAGSSFFDLDVAKDLGLRLGGGFRAGGAGAGSVEGAYLDPTPILIPDAAVSVTARSAIALGRVSLGEGYPMQGILGYDFIAGHVMAIDYRNRELLLYDAKKFTYEGPGAVVPITSMSRNHPQIRAEVLLADGSRVPGTFIVDVGASSGLALAKPFVERNRLRDRVGPTIRAPSGGGVGGISVADIGRVAGLKIGPYELQRPVASLYGDSAGVFSDSLWDGNIGGEVLRRFKVYFDYSRKQMILEPHEGTSEAFEADMSGVRFRADTSLSAIGVMFVLAGSPGAEAGLLPGDRLLAVDGIAPTNRTLVDLRRRLRREGERVTLSVRRGDTRLDVQVVTRRLL